MSIIKQCYCINVYYIHPPSYYYSNPYNAYLSDSIPLHTGKNLGHQSIQSNPTQPILAVRQISHTPHHDFLLAHNIYQYNHATKLSHISRRFMPFTSGTDPDAFHTRVASTPSSYREDPAHLSSAHFAPRGLGSLDLLEEVVPGYHTLQLACSSGPACL